MFMFKMGRKPARFDGRIARLSQHTPSLPPPPPSTYWGAAVGTWGMLGNDLTGDCVEACALHAIQQFSTYAGKPLNPTTEDAMAFYAAATGYDPSQDQPDGSNPTDDGSYVMGPSGVMEYWHKTGVTCGGTLNKVEAFLQITQPNPSEWMKGIYYFGGMCVGINLPENLVSSDQDPPFVWSDYSGPVAGGHEIWINGYTTISSGYRTYDIISWGTHYRVTEDFLEHVIAEAVVLYNPAAMNARGVDASGLNHDQIIADMAELHGEDVA